MDLNSWFFKKRLYFNYYLKKFLKSAISKLAYLLFLLSYIMLLSVLIPGFSNRLPILNNWDKIFEIAGYIKNYNNQKITIEVGGYKTNVKTDGSFELKFASKNKIVPIIIEVDDLHYLKRIDLEYADLKNLSLDLIELDEQIYYQNMSGWTRPSWNRFCPGIH